MTLKRAIEILSSNGLCPKNTTWGDFQEAGRIGVEAMKRIAFNRLDTIASSHGLLPGETED